MLPPRPLQSDNSFSRCLDQHAKSFSCDTAHCMRKFGSKNDLSRHKREVHGKDDEGRALKLWNCPDVNCERHARGFPRSWNLRDHCQRIHGIEMSSDVALSDGLGSTDFDYSDFSDALSTQCSSPQLQARVMDNSSDRLPGKVEQFLQPLLREIQSKSRSMQQEKDILDEKISLLRHKLDLLDNADCKRSRGSRSPRLQAKRFQQSCKHTSPSTKSPGLRTF